MSNRRPALLLVLACSAAARAQSPALLEAVRVHRAGVVDTARAELQACYDAKCPEADRLSLLLGFLLLSESDAAAAATQLAERSPPKGLEAFHGWYLGEALSWSGDPAGALKVFSKAKKPAPPWLQRRIDARMGELWLGLNDAKKAQPLLEAATTGDFGPELLYQRGVARWLNGDSKRGQADLRAVAVRYPSHPYATRAEELLGHPSYTFDEHLSRAASLGGARAVTELEGLTAPPGREGKLELALAAAYFSVADDVKGNAQLDSAAKRGPGVASEALMARSRRFMKVHDNAQARKVMLEIEAKHHEQPVAEDAAYLAAWLAMQAGDFEAAATEFGTFDTAHADSKKRDEARWFKAYSEYRAGRCSPDTFKSLVDDFPKSSLVPQARYWLARCLQKQLGNAAGPGRTAARGDASASQRAADPASPGRRSTQEIALVYRSIISAYPQSFYALLASERLRELGETPQPPFTVEPKTLSVPPPKELELAMQLSAAGLFRDAGLEVDRLLGTVKSADQALKLGHALQGIGEYGPAYSVALRWLWGPAFGRQDPAALALFYPRAFDESVEKFSAEVGLDPYLAWAIMRQESAFRPEVTSSADARGLMQLIPPTADSIAKTRNITAPHPAELYAPEKSIALGTWLLSALLERFGHPSLCAAAYNAGAKPVAEWASTRNALPLDEFVEAIPWKETRGYVKNVTANYFVYRTFYARSGEPWRLPLTVPAPKATGVNF
ncbi:MAG: transglycosylase SLT domain-containing protein [Myxococcaceae bacterium]|nr:transglycosylase SLT domain-containing protein [Myxococcaceae bacterium]